MLKKFLVSLGIVSLVVPTLVFAATFRHNANLAANETVTENLYIAGPNLLVAGNVKGDLFAAGGTVTVSGNVDKDVMIAGGDVNLAGNVGEDLRLFGGHVILDGTVKGEVLVAGGDLKIGPHAVINGDLLGSVGTLTIDPQAKILGHQHIVKGEKPRQIREEVGYRKWANGAFFAGKFFSLLMAVFVGVIFFGFFKKPAQVFVEEGLKKNQFWGNLGLGFLVLFLTPIVILISLITGIGILFGFILLFAYIIFILVSIVFAGYLFGGLIFQYLRKNPGEQIGWLWIILGIVLLHVVGIIPILGGIIGFFFFLLAMGSILRLKYISMKKI